MATLPFPADTAFSYNGFTFPVAVHTRLSEEPVTSNDNRNVKMSKLTIEANGFITQDDADTYAASFGLAAGQRLDSLMLAIRRQLQVNGKSLKYLNRGYGTDLQINTAGAGIRDVFFGPKPGKFIWWPLGGAPNGVHGAGFSWSVTTYLAECALFQIAPKVFIEIAYTLDFSVDEHGLVVITHQGTAQIPMSLRIEDGLLDRNVDDEISAIIRPTPPGFLRQRQRRLSADRAVCTFTLIDRQLEVPYPQDVTHIDMHQRVRQEKQFSPNWACTLSATVRLSPTANRFLAYERFFNIAAQRIAHVRRFAPQGAGKLNVLVTTCEFDEDLFKNEAHFTINYRILGTFLNKIIAVSGLWRPIMSNATLPLNNLPGWTAEEAAESLANNAQFFKGVLGASFPNSDEVIIDICEGPTDQRLHSTSLALSAEEVVNQTHVSPAEFNAEVAKIEPSKFQDDEQISVFEPATSWLAWECAVDRIIDHRQIRHKPLAGEVTKTPPSVDPFGQAPPLAENTSNAAGDYTASVPDVIQQTAAPSLTLRLRGFGVRADYRVNPPKLVGYAGQTPVLQSEIVREQTLGISSSVKIYRTDWELIYLVPGPTEAVPVLANPLLNTDGAT